jgi:UPF0716 protein FxsA
MAPLIFVLLLIVPIAELYVIIQVGDLIGIIPTLLILIAVSIAGTYYLRLEGTATWNRLQETLARGEMPTKEVSDGFMILLGGAFLLTPGFLTDIAGLLLLIPPTRAVIKRFFRTFVFARLARRHPAGAAGVYTVKVIRERRRAEQSAAKEEVKTPRRNGAPEELPPQAPREGEGGSRGTG